MASELSGALQALQEASQDLRDLERAWDDVHSALSEIEDPALVIEELLGTRGQLLTVLHKSVVAHGKDGRKLREDILKELATQLAAAEPAAVQPYAPELIRSCPRFLWSEVNVGPRVQWLGILSTLLHWQLAGKLPLQQQQQSLLQVALAIQEVYIKQQSKLGSTLKSAMLGVLGLLLQLAGDGNQQFSSSWLQQECQRLLSTSQDNKAGKEVEGALAGLMAVVLLQQGSEPAAEDELYKWSMGLVSDVVNRLKSKSSVSYYGAYRTALSCLASCSEKFARKFTADTQHVLEQLMYLRTESANKSMRTAAEEALTAAFDQISLQLLAAAVASEGDQQEQQQQGALLKALLQHLGVVLVTGSPRHGRAVVTGLERLMPAVGRLLGLPGLSEIQGLLSPLVLRWAGPSEAAGADDYSEGRLDNLLALLRCLSALLAQLPQDSLELCFQTALTAADSIIAGYLELWDKQQAPAHAAVLLLLRAAAQQGVSVLLRVTQHVAGVLLAHSLKPLSAQQMSVGPLVALASGAGAPESWQLYKQLWAALLSPDSETLQHLNSRTLTKPKQQRRSSAGAVAALPQAQQQTAGAEDAALTAASAALYNGLIGCSIDALQQLDVSYTLQDSAATQGASGTGRASAAGGAAPGDVSVAAVAAAAETGAGLVAKTPGDMLAFGQLSALLCSLLPDCGSERFAPWAYPLSSVVVAGSRRLPLLAPYYSLATACLKLSSTAGLLRPPEARAAAAVGGSALSSAANPPAQRSCTPAATEQQQAERVSHLFCVQLFQEYLRSVLASCQQYKDELLAAALQLLLAAPASMLPARLLAVPLQLALQNIALAELAVAALEAWEQEQPGELQALLPKVIPHLAPYLGDVAALAANSAAEAATASQSADAESGQDPGLADGGNVPGLAEEEETAPEALRRAGQDPDSFSKQQRAAAAAAKEGQLTRQQGLVALQPRIQLWLGRRGAASQLLLSAPEAPGAGDAEGQNSDMGSVRTSLGLWDPIPRVGVPVVFPQLPDAIQVFLDPVLPAIAAAAESHPVRSVRVAACEVLHAITLWMVGSNARRPLAAAARGAAEEEQEQLKATPFHKVYQQLFPVLLRCAGSSEPVARQLFGPLLTSLVHWFTRSASREGAEAMSLVDALMGALCQGSSGALRETAGRLVGEWLAWSYKHKVAGGKGVTFNAVSLLRRLFDRLTHPQGSQRLGAAVGLMFCARVMPPELCEQYLLEALHLCIHGLTLIKDIDQEQATAAQLPATLSSLTTHCLPKCLDMLVEPQQQQNTQSSGNQPPPNSGPAAFSSLSNFLGWLWPLTAAQQPAARVAAQQLHQLLSAELLEALGGSGGAAVAAGAAPDAGPSAKWLHLHSGGSTAAKEMELQQQLQLAPVPPSILEAFADSTRAPQAAATMPTAAAAGLVQQLLLRQDVARWLPFLAARLDWTRWALEQRMMDLHDLQWLSSRCAMGSSTLEQLLLFLQLLPSLDQLVAASNSPSTAAVSAAEGQPGLTSASWTQCGGPLAGADRTVRAVVTATARLLQQLVGTMAPLQWAAGRLPHTGRTAAGAVRGGGGEAEVLVSQLSLLGVLTPGLLGFGPSEGAGRQQLSRLLLAFLPAAATTDTSKPLQQQLQADVAGFVQKLLLPGLQQSKEGGLQVAGATNTVAGLSALLSQVSAPGLPPLLSPILRQKLAGSCLDYVLLLQLRAATPSALEAADGALQLALQLGLPHDQLLQQLLHSPAGPQLYQAFKGTLHGWLLFNMQRLVPRLMRTLADSQDRTAAAASGAVTSSSSGMATSSAAGQSGATGAQPGLVAELLLLGVCQGLQHTQAQSGRQDIRTHSWVATLLKELHTLAPLVSPAATTEARTLYLTVLRSMLVLNSTAVLSPAQPYYNFVIQSYISLTTLTSPQDAAVQTQAVQLLGRFLVQLPASDVGVLVSPVQHIVAGFGTGTPQDRSSAAAVQYRQRLVALLQATAAAAAGDAAAAATLMLDALLPEVQKMGRHLAPSSMGPQSAAPAAAEADAASGQGAPGNGLKLSHQHAFHQEYETGMYLVAAAAWQSTSQPTDGAASQPGGITAGSGAASAAGGADVEMQDAAAEPVGVKLLDWCWQLVLGRTSSYQVPLVMGVVVHVMVPLLQAATPEQRAAWYTHHVAPLLAAADKGVVPGLSSHGAGAEQQVLLVKWLGYRLLRLMYELLTKEELEPVLSQLPGRNQAIIKPAARDCKELPASQPALEPAARLVRCEAWSSMATLLRCTQSNAKFFRPAMFAKHENSPGDLWSNFLDPQLPTSFPVVAPSGGGRSRLMQSAAAVQAVKQEMRARRAARGPGAAGFTQFGTMATLFGGTLADFSLGGSSTTFDPAVSDLAAKVSATQFKLAGSQELVENTAGDGEGGRGAAVQQPPAATGQPAGDSSSPGGLTDGEEEQLLQLRSTQEHLITCDDAYDAHPCMLPLVLLLERAQQLPSDIPGSMPSWLELLMTGLKDESAPLNSRVFLARAVLHVEARHQQKKAAHQQQLLLRQQQQEQGLMAAPEEEGTEAPKASLLAQHAAELFPALVSVLVPPESSIILEQVQQGGFNYVLRDLVLIILPWDDVFAGRPGSEELRAGSEVQRAAEKLLRYLVLLGYSSEREVRKANSEYIRVLLSRWGPRVPLTGAELLAHLRPKASTATSSTTTTSSTTRDEGSAELASRLQYGLEMLALALWVQQGATLLQGPKGEALWGVVHKLLLKPGMKRRCANLLGSVTGLMLKELAHAQQHKQQQEQPQPSAKKQRPDFKQASLAVVLEVSQVSLGMLVGARLWPTLLAFLAAARQHYAPLLDGPVCKWLIEAVGASENENKPQVLTGALQLLHVRADQSKDMFTDLHNQQARTWLFNKGTPAQAAVVNLAALQLLTALLPQQQLLDASQLLLRLAPQYVQHTNARCRSLFLELLIATWQRFAAEGGVSAAAAPGGHGGAVAPGGAGQGDCDRQQQMQLLERTLFCMLADEDAKVHLAAQAFWNDVLPKQVDQRLEALLVRVCQLGAAGFQQLPASCQTALERAWPRAAAALLLQLVQSDPRYSSRQYYPEALADCEYQEMQVDTTAPGATFSATMGSTQILRMTQGGASGTFGTGTLGYTASQHGNSSQGRSTGVGLALATPTAGVTFAPSNVVTVPLSLAADATGGMGYTGATQASQGAGLLTSGGSATLRRRSNIRSNRFSDGRPYAAYAGLRRRAAAEHSAAARANKIRLYRQYRTGELPDVQAVTPAALLAPLSVVAAVSPGVAGDLVTAVAAAVRSGVEGSHVQPKALLDLAAAIQNTFTSRPSDPALIHVLQQLARQDAHSWIPPAAVAAAAHASSDAAAAAVQLEEQMLYSAAADTSPAEPAGAGRAKRAAATSAAAAAAKQRYPLAPQPRTDGDAWQQLGILYQDMAGCGDVLEVIRIQQIVKCPGSLVALAAADDGQHQLALDTFESLLDALEQEGPPDTSRRHLLGDHGCPSDAEQDLWYAERMQCLQSLGQWELVEQQIEADLCDGLDVAPTGSPLPTAALLKLLLPPERSAQAAADAATNAAEGQEDASSPADYTCFLRPYIRACLFGSSMSRLKVQGLVAVAEQSKEALVEQRLQAVAGLEVAAWELTQRHVERCKAVLSACLQSLSRAWSTSTSGSSAGRLTSLTKLQPLSEIQEVLQLLQPVGPSSGPAAAAATAAGLQPQQVNALVNRWLTRWPVAGEGTSEQQQMQGRGGQGQQITGSAAAEAVWAVLGVRQLLLEVLMGQPTVGGQGIGLEVSKATDQLRLAAAQALTLQGLPDAAAAVFQQHHQHQAVHLGQTSAPGQSLVNPNQLLTQVVMVQLTSRRLKGSSSSPVSVAQQLAPAVQALYSSVKDPPALLAAGVPAALLSGALSSLAEALLALAKQETTTTHHQQSANTPQQHPGAAQQQQQQQQAKRLSMAVQHQEQALDILTAAAGAAAAGAAPEQPQQQVAHGLDAAWAPVAADIALQHLRFALLCNELKQAAGEQQHSSGLTIDQKWLTPTAQQVLATADQLVVQHLLQAMGAQSRSGAEARLFLPAVLSALSHPSSACPPSDPSATPTPAPYKHSSSRQQQHPHTGPTAATTSSTTTGRQGSLPPAQQAFLDHWRGVPVEVYMPWVAQMLSRLGEAEGCVLVAPLEQLAQQHPQRVYLPFQLSNPHWSLTAHSHGAQLQQLLGPSNPALGDLPAFVDALDQTTYPAQRWQAWHLQLHGLISKGDREAAVKLYQEQIWPNMVQRPLEQGQDSSASSAGPRRRGRTINYSIAAKHQALFKSLFGDHGERLRTMDMNAYKVAAGQVSQKLRADTDTLHGERQLRDLTPWFQQFTDHAAASHLDRPPLLLPVMPSPYSSSSSDPWQQEQQQVSIVGFGCMVNVFSSKQKPKLLRVYGSDFRSHLFVLKGGEDLRLDERIQQLWRLLGGLAGRHPAAATRGLTTALTTFDVVPMSPALGMVVFVKDTRPLQSLLPEQPIQAAAAAYQGLLQPRSAAARAAGWSPQWFTGAYARPDAEMVAGLQRCEELLPWDALRAALQQGAPNAASWLQRRAAYVSSLAAGSAWGWLAGVGDRHLQNLLLQESTGAVVPIDFGYSFGTAVGLPVPELTPFRFTRQLRGVLQPHDADAVLQPAMAAALEACRVHQEVLAPILDIFLLEPLSEWAKETLPGASQEEAAAAAALAASTSSASAQPELNQQQQQAPGGQQRGRSMSSKSARASSAAGASSSATSQAAVVAAVKVRAARQRLAGGHPVACLLKEAAAHHRLAPFWPALETLLLSVAADCSTAAASTHSIAQVEPSVEQQLWQVGEGAMGQVPQVMTSQQAAQVLLQLAHSPKLLSRAWMGWLPFV